MKIEKYIFNLTFRQKEIKVPLPAVIVAFLLILTTIYLPLFKNNFTNWDDGLYVLYSPYLKNLTISNLKYFCREYYAGNYHPLTLISLSLDYKMGGIEPWTYHLTNLLLHLLNTLLVFFFIKNFLNLAFYDRGKAIVVSLITMILFGMHTLQIESVAWVSERKTVLYVFFFLLSLIFYLRYIKRNSIRFYFLALFMFLLSLLSKGMALPLSICLIIIDYYADRKVISKKIILEKIPFIVLSVVFGIIAIKAQHSSDAIKTETAVPWISRIVFAGYGFINYLAKLGFPFHLSAFYPYPVKSGNFLPVEYYICLALTILLLFIIWRFFRKNKLVLSGILFFIANISIVIQLLPVGDAVMADRYVYVASIGFFMIIGHYATLLFGKTRIVRSAALVILFMYFTILGIKTYNRIGVWKDSLSLWNDALKTCPENNDRGYLNRGNILFEMGEHTKAFEDFNKLLQIDPKSSGAYIGMGRIKYAMNDIKGAMNDMNIALSLSPTYEGFINRAVLKIETGDFESALADLDEAYKISRFRTGVYINRGMVHLKKGNYKEALENYTMAIQIDPQSAKAYIGLGKVKQALNDMQGALVDFSTALSLQSSYDGFISRAVLKIALQDFNSALADLDNASQINPQGQEIFINRGIIELNSGNFNSAINEFNRVLENNNKNFLAYLYRAIAEMRLEEFDKAMNDFNISINQQPNSLAFFYRGILNLQLGNKLNACSDLEQSANMGNEEALEELKLNCK